MHLERVGSHICKLNHNLLDVIAQFRVFQLFLDLICLPTVDKLRKTQTLSNADPFTGANSPDNSGTVNQQPHRLHACYCRVADEPQLS